LCFNSISRTKKADIGREFVTEYSKRDKKTWRERESNIKQTRLIYQKTNLVSQQNLRAYITGFFFFFLYCGSALTRLCLCFSCCLDSYCCPFILAFLLYFVSSFSFGFWSCLVWCFYLLPAGLLSLCFAASWLGLQGGHQSLLCAVSCFCFKGFLFFFLQFSIACLAVVVLFFSLCATQYLFLFMFPSQTFSRSYSLSTIVCCFEIIAMVI